MEGLTSASLDALLEKLGPDLKNLIRYSSAINAKDINFYKSLDPTIRDSADSIDADIIDTMNEIVSSVASISNDPSDSRFKFGSDHENNLVLSNVLDTLLERVELNLDNHYKAKKNQNYIKPQELSTQSSSAENDGYTYLDKSDNGQRLPVKSNNTMDKPQEKFLSTVDNFETTPFHPLIKFKPNAIKSLEESLELVEATDDVPEHYENPYSYEIMNQEYPDWILSPVPEEEQFQSTDWETSDAAIWIDQPEQLEELLIELNKCKVIAIDLEHHDYRTYHGLTSLMQITTETKKDYLIDPLSPNLRPHLTILNEAFTNPQIIKVLHGAFMDVIWLQRDLGLYLVSLFDTFHASKQLSLGKYSLAYLLEYYVKFRTSKKWQLADWRIRPLSDEMKDYAKADTHFLIEVFYKIHSELLKVPNALQKTLYASRKVANRRFEYATFRPKNLSLSSNNEVVTTTGSVPQLDDIINKQITTFIDRDLPWTHLIYSNNITLEKRPLLEILFKWRDSQARKHDESPRFIMNDFILVSLVNAFEIGKEDAVDMNSVLSVINKSSRFGSSAYFIRKYVKELTAVIKDALVNLKGVDLNQLYSFIDTKDETPSTSHVNVDFENIYESVTDVNKLQKSFGNFANFYSKNMVPGEVKLVEMTKPEKEEKQAFAVSYTSKGDSRVVTSDSIGERIADVVSQFEADLNKPVELEIDEEQIQAYEEEEQQKIAEEEIKEENTRDEIITLRKKQQQQQSKSKKRKADDEILEDLDFTKNVMKLEEENNGRRKRNKKEVKKPSFDPYSRDLLDDMNVPQLKKKKMVDRGKNMVFKKK
ncbi:hypothetical protein CANINC_001628 [Pichia inconspicua]|uniref:HRDC domain-containing protein n=1 Tax=Pichia inconspicua TaxID=52247 RepID=A0A4T0X3N1_9ASCO|nr:hypothetical protein CANINC_001628 [[Candida] inconspicua]